MATAGLTLGVIFVSAIALAQIVGPDSRRHRDRDPGRIDRRQQRWDARRSWVDGNDGRGRRHPCSSTSTGLIAGLADFGVVLILGVLLTFYFLRDGHRLWGSLISRLSPWRRREIDEAGGRSVGVLGGYMGGTAVVSAVGAISQYLIMTVLGLPYAVPIAILSFFLCFIPYIGGFITTGLAFLIAVAAGDTTTIVIMAVWTVVFNIVQGNIVSPLVYGRTVQLHPAIVLLAIPAGGEIAGVIGMFLVVPFLGVDRDHVADGAASRRRAAERERDPGGGSGGPGGARHPRQSNPRPSACGAGARPWAARRLTRSPASRRDDPCDETVRAAAAYHRSKSLSRTSRGPRPRGQPSTAGPHHVLGAGAATTLPW